MCLIKDCSCYLVIYVINRLQHYRCKWRPGGAKGLVRQYRTYFSTLTQSGSNRSEKAAPWKSALLDHEGCVFYICYKIKIFFNKDYWIAGGRVQCDLRGSHYTLLNLVWTREISVKNERLDGSLCISDSKLRSHPSYVVPWDF